MKKFLGFVAIAFLVFFIAKNPTGAAATFKGIGSVLAATASGLGNFATSLAGKH